MTVWLVWIWTHKNADEKVHTFLWRSKNVKKRTKADEKRILCKFALNGITSKKKLHQLCYCDVPTLQTNLRRTNNANKFCEVSLKKVQVIKLDPPKISRNRRACLVWWYYTFGMMDDFVFFNFTVAKFCWTGTGTLLLLWAVLTVN